MIFISLIIGIVYYKYQYFRLKKHRKDLIEIKRRMFPAFIKKVLILLRTNNVYNSLLKMVEYTEEPIKGYLLELLDEMKVDKTENPFNNFARKLEFIEAYQTMITFYTFSENIVNIEHLKSLESVVSKLYDNELNDNIERKKRSLWLYPNISILLMLGYIFVLVIYMFINMMGQMSL